MRANDREPIIWRRWQKIPAEEIDRAVRRGHVHYLGTRSDVVKMVVISDMFVLPAYYREGIPRVLMEASACSLPLVASDVPGCRDVVTNGENGLLVQPRDSIALANAIAKLFEDGSLRARMGQRAKQIVKQRFDLEVIADQYEEIYRGFD